MINFNKQNLPFLKFKIGVLFSKNILSLKLLSFFALVMFGGSVLGQTTIFTENMGTPSGTTAIASNTFQNSTGSLVYSGTGDVRSTTVSSGYTGATGGGNVYITNTNGINFQIASINTSSYTSISLSFGIFKSLNLPDSNN